MVFPDFFEIKRENTGGIISCRILVVRYVSPDFISLAKRVQYFESVPFLLFTMTLTKIDHPRKYIFDLLSTF